MSDDRRWASSRTGHALWSSTCPSTLQGEAGVAPVADEIDARELVANAFEGDLPGRSDQQIALDDAFAASAFPQSPRNP
jgi:hypothetical protein